MGLMFINKNDCSDASLFHDFFISLLNTATLINIPYAALLPGLTRLQ